MFSFAIKFKRNALHNVPIPIFVLYVIPTLKNHKIWYFRSIFVEPFIFIARNVSFVFIIFFLEYFSRTPC